MEKDDTAFVSSPLVRRYSHQLAQEGRDDRMSSALIASVEHEEKTEQVEKNNIQDWNGWLHNVGPSKSTYESRLESQKQLLVNEWRKLASSHHFKITADQTIQGIPTIDDLWKAVETAGDSWQEKSEDGFHKLRDRFCSFAGSMGNYSYLFEVIPSGDKYFSLITGVVSSLIKVSANYQKAAEAFSQGLKGLGNSLTFVGNEVSISSTDLMKNHVVELYIEVFSFLCQAFEWFTSRTYRWRTALNSQYVNKKIVEMVARITQIVSNIRREAEQSSRRRVINLEDKVDKLKITNDDTLLEVKNVLVQLRLASHQGKQDLTEALDVALGKFMSLTLQAFEQQALHESTRDTVELIGDTDTYNRYDIESRASLLQKYIEDGRHRLPSMSRILPKSGLSTDVLHIMGNWLKAPETKFLCIEGYVPPGAPSMLSLAAMQLCDIALEAKLPCLSHFCQPKSRGKNQPGMTDKQAGLIALLYSTILQLTQLLPLEFRANTDFSQKRFDQFNGAFSTAGEALRLIEDLSDHLDGMTHWILDSINFIEDRDTRPHILELIEILRRTGERTICKVCFTTSANSYVLNKALAVTERKKEHGSSTKVSGRINHGINAEAFRSVISRSTSPTP